MVVDQAGRRRLDQRLVARLAAKRRPHAALVLAPLLGVAVGARAQRQRNRLANRLRLEIGRRLAERRVLRGEELTERVALLRESETKERREREKREEKIGEQKVRKKKVRKKKERRKRDEREMKER